ncbi:hypothetical protein VTL71DRAFT_15759 [Oculimacula yallundae]|uniref:Uncharacterized protein n=1 Tax=Oculimacula yallundae TaxID=86028 RepID=A0ABR4CCI3_9HELO
MTVFENVKPPNGNVLKPLHVLRQTQLPSPSCEADFCRLASRYPEEVQHQYFSPPILSPPSRFDRVAYLINSSTIWIFKSNLLATRTNRVAMNSTTDSARMSTVNQKHQQRASSPATAKNPSSRPPTGPAMYFTSSTPGVKPMGHSSIQSIYERGPRRFTSSTMDRNTRQPRSRSHSPYRHEDIYARAGWEHRSRSRSRAEVREGDRESDHRDRDRRSRSRSPRRRLLMDYSPDSSDQSPVRYSHDDMRHRSASLEFHQREHRTPTPVLEKPLSWQQIAELSTSDYGKEFALRYYSNPYRLWTFPPSESQPITTSAEFPYAVPKPHIDIKTGKPHYRMRFTDPNTMSLLLGKEGSSLAELSLFFPAVVFRFEEALNIPDPIMKKRTWTFWLEVKSSADPKNDGVKWQIDACRNGFEAYCRTDPEGLSCVTDFYYANRRVFHHSRTAKGLYQQGLPRPTNQQELMAQVSLKDYTDVVASLKPRGKGLVTMLRDGRKF